MNSYMPMKFKLRIKWLYWSPNYISITRGIMAPSGAIAILGISLANGNENANGSGATESGGITKGWWCRGIH
jgi:hypothetical protein